MVSSPQIAEEQSPKVEFKVNLSLNELIVALRSLDAEDREFFLENLLAALSPEYLKSIKEARQDYKGAKTVETVEIV